MARPKKQSAPPPDHNEAELQEIIRAETANVVMLERKRKAINDDISASRSKIKACKIDMDAWKASKRRQAMDPDVRAEFDRSHQFINAALGVPVQGSLFGENDDAAEDDGGKAADAAEFDALEKGNPIPAGALN